MNRPSCVETQASSTKALDPPRRCPRERRWTGKIRQSAGKGCREAGEAHLRPAACALRRREVRAADRFAGQGRIGKGWNDPEGVHGGKPPGVRGLELQGADRARAKPRLPVGGSCPGAGARNDRDLQPPSLPRRDTATGSRKHPQKKKLETFRPSQRIREDA